MSLSGDHYKRLEEALLYAFPDKPSLSRMLWYELNKNLDTIAGEDNLQNIVCRLIKTADAERWVPDLINAARKSIPRNELLKNIADELLPLLSSSKGKVPNFKNKPEYEITPEPEPPTKTPPTPPKRRKFLELVIFGSGGLAIALLTSEFIKNVNPPIIPPFNITPPPKPPKPPIPPLETFEFDVVTVDSEGNITNSQTNKAKFFKEDLGNDINLEMVKIPGHCFTMGTKNEEIEKLVKQFGEAIRTDLEHEQPPQKVDIPTFFMGKFEVTQEQYEQVMGEGEPKKLHQNQSNIKFKADKHPVIFVSWKDAEEFCKKLNQKTGRTYRLPTEAEWEYAARAGTTTPFYFGETITRNVVNYNSSGTTEVGKFPYPNNFGLYDMHGNVDEWCKDHKDKDTSLRARRGGSWLHAPEIARSARRGWWREGTQETGFRVMWDIS